MVIVGPGGDLDTQRKSGLENNKLNSCGGVGGGGYLAESYRNNCGRESHQVHHGGVEEVERFRVALVVKWRRGGMYWAEQHSVITQDVPHFVPQQLNLIRHVRICLLGAPEDGGHLRDPLHQCL